jgi:hypothetical protein
LVFLGSGVRGWQYNFLTDLKYWIFTGWAFFEGTHSYLYKLSFGKRDSLQYIVETLSFGHLFRPLGGAVGVELRKLKRRQTEYLS